MGSSIISDTIVQKSLSRVDGVLFWVGYLFFEGSVNIGILKGLDAWLDFQDLMKRFLDFGSYLLETWWDFVDQVVFRQFFIEAGSEFLLLNGQGQVQGAGGIVPVCLKD